MGIAVVGGGVMLGGLVAGGLCGWAELALAGAGAGLLVMLLGGWRAARAEWAEGHSKLAAYPTYKY